MPNSTSSEAAAAEPSAANSSKAPVESSLTAIAIRDQELLEFLDLSGRRDPELQKLLTRVYEARVEAGRVVDRGEVLESAVRQFRDLAATDFKGLGLDGALELVEEWDRWLFENADETYILSLVEAEYLRAKTDKHGTPVTWTDVYPQEETLPASLKFRSGARIEAEELTAARRRLAGLYRARANDYGIRRARTKFRTRNLLVLTVAMVAVSVVTVAALFFAYPGRPLAEILIAPAAGALGAALSGARQLLKSMPRINVERDFWRVLLAQTTVGASVGIGVLLFLDGGFVPLEVRASPIALIGAAAFLGGFSEPFFLGIVERLTASGTAQTAPA